MARKKPVAPGPKLIIKGTFGPPGTPAQRAARLQQKALGAAHRRRKEWALLIATLVITGVALIVAIVLLAFEQSPEKKSWAMGLITTIVAGYLGFWSGSQSQKK